ncbi:MAG TPA: cytochrome c biogenesis protein CcdA [Streptosporangiaceae bacterium]|nr:cytochrome c biogenesis protein CcdA [Streptosporangiaceae bacterium]
MSGVSQFVFSGPLLLAMPVAAAAGAITFLSPCCLPLVPGFISYVTGMAGSGGNAPAAAPAPALAGAAVTAGGAATASGAATGKGAVASPPVPAAPPVAPAPPAAPPRSRIVVGTLLFVIGFSLVFVAEGAIFGSLGHLLTGHGRLVTRVLGGVTIVLGLLFAGAFDRFSFAGRIVRPAARPQAGLAGAPLLGIMFGLGWTPCIGPTLTAVDMLSTSTGTALRGGLLAFVYCLGLGIPFLLMALGASRAMRAFAFARRHAAVITRIGGAMLICVGLLEVTGVWYTFISWLQTHWTSYEAPL